MKNYCEACKTCQCNTCAKSHIESESVCYSWCEDTDIGCGKNGTGKAQGYCSAKQEITQ